MLKHIWSATATGGNFHPASANLRPLSFIVPDFLNFPEKYFKKSQLIDHVEVTSLKLVRSYRHQASIFEAVLSSLIRA